MAKNKAAITNSSLTKIASELEEKGLSKSAAVIKEVNQVLTQMKEAQYVGVQGQAIRNRRCWDNCYRNKRAKTPDRSAQVVWFECWDEYLKSMKDSTSWDKYASIDKLAKDEGWNQKFSEKVKNKIKSGMSIPEAVYDTFNEESERYTNEILKQAGNLTELAVALNDSEHKDIAIKIADASNEILKESQFWQGVGDVARGIMNPLETAKNWMARKQQLLKKLENFVKKSIDLSKRLKQQVRYTKGFNLNKIKEAALGEAGETAGTGDNPAGNAAPVDPAAPISPAVASPAQSTDYKVQYIQEAQNLASEAQDLISWMGSAVPQDNPRVANIVQTAVYNLTSASKQITDFAMGGNIDVASLVGVIDNMADAANKAMFSIYQEPDTETPATETQDVNMDGKVDALDQQTGDQPETAAQSVDPNTKAVVDRVLSGQGTPEDRQPFIDYYKNFMKQQYNPVKLQFDKLKDAYVGLTNPPANQQATASQTKGKRILAKILNKNKGILRN